MLKAAARVVLVVAFGISSVPVLAANVTISKAWFRALPSGQPAGGYFTMHNWGAASVDLVAAQSTACRMLMLHKTDSGGGMSRMGDVKSVTVPAGMSVSFAPGNYHLMCMDPGPTMTPGKFVAVTLAFSDGGKVNATFAVKNAAGN